MKECVEVVSKDGNDDNWSWETWRRRSSLQECIPNEEAASCSQDVLANSFDMSICESPSLKKNVSSYGSEQVAGMHQR